MIGRTYVIGIMLLLCIPIVLGATSPTVPPNVAPGNDTVKFGNHTLTCAGSTDAEGEPINYSFRVSQLSKSSTGYNVYDAVVAGAGSTYTVGSSYASPYEFDTPTSADARFLTTWVGVNTDNLTIDFIEILEDANTDIKIFLNGTEIYDPVAGSTGNKSINTTLYNDGNMYMLNISFEDTNGAGNAEMKWWGEWGPTFDPVQNSLSTTYEFDSVGKTEWDCRACDNESGCSAYTNESIVNTVDFYDCADPSYLFNFTWKDEELDAYLPDDLNFYYYFEDNESNVRYDNFTNASSYYFCGFPSNITFEIDGYVDYLPINDTYSFHRQYYFNNYDATMGLNDSIVLYSLADTNDEVVLLTVKDIQNNPVQGALIHVQRYLSGTWQTAFMLGTDSTGRASGNYLLNNYYYNHVIIYGDDIVYGAMNSDDDKIRIFAEDVVNGLTFIINTFGDTLADVWYNIQDLYYAISYTNTSNTTGYFTFEYVDTSGTQWDGCLEVQNGTDPEVYTNCSCADTLTSSSSAIITCTVNQSAGRSLYQGVGYFYINNTSYSAASLALVLGADERISWGSLGFAVAFLVQLAILFLFINSPSVNLLVGTLTLVLFVAVGVIFQNLSYTALSVLVFLTFLIARIKSEGGPNG